MSDVAKLSVSFPHDLADEARSAASDAGMTMSAWLAESVRRTLRRRAAVAALDAYEAEHGVITEKELAAQGAPVRTVGRRRASA